MESIHITIPRMTDVEKGNLLLNYASALQKADNHIIQFLHTQKCDYLVHAITEYETLLSCVEITDYLLIGSENEHMPKYVYIESYYKLGTYYKTLAEKLVTIKKLKGENYKLVENEESLFKRSIYCFITVKRVDFDHQLSITQLMSVYSQLCYHSQSDLIKSLGYLNEAMVFSPENSNINYNLGFVYQKLNKLESSLTHYKLSVFTSKFITDEKERNTNYLNCYNGISGIYRSIKQWPEALHYLLKAAEYGPTEPSINNQLGVVYTEMRRTDLAIVHYEKAIHNVKDSIIVPDTKFLLSEIFLNMGHMFSYNGNNEDAIKCYNNSLNISPKFIMPFQNKIFNLCYMYHDIDDKNYVSNQHKKINTLYKANGNEDHHEFNFEHLKTNGKKNIGIISGDFIDHPVSFFINTFLSKYDQNLFNVYCYSECIIDTSLVNKNINFKFIRHKTTHEVCDLIYNDNIFILFDLAGHTAFNRLDVFSRKPAPIQINYIGYPYTTGLKTMDYRITDRICDDPEISQPHYTEKLLFLPDTFLCYNPIKVSKQSVNQHPELTNIQPYLKNGHITFGCFNRLNKINDMVIKMYNKILCEFTNAKFVFKTKAIINHNIASKFLDKFDKHVRERIVLNDCTILHEQHLSEYNKIDISIDTFPYSGTTTSCESLYMGVPVFSMYDDVNYYHPQNVTCSILKNSGLDEFICKDTSDLISKINILISRDATYWEKLKQNTRNTFLNGKVCDQITHMKNLTKLLTELNF